MRWPALMEKTRRCFAGLTDARKGKNKQFGLVDFALNAFAVFYTQSPSFLSYQKTMLRHKGRSNAQTIFQVEDIPCDNQIRDVLDHVSPGEVFPLYDEVFAALKAQGRLEPFRSVHNTIPIALDGTWFTSSQKIHCENCSCIEHANGRTTHYHSAVTPVIVAPGRPHALSLRPEFIVPQDGHKKQDCEVAAAKRWIAANSARYAELKATLLGDDIYAHQPLCRCALLYDFHFIFVCKPDSHTSLYDWVKLLQPGTGLQELKLRLKKDGHWQRHTYRFAQQVPLAEGDDALKVNWCDVTITDDAGEAVYQNGFITDFEITADNVAGIVATARARWKIENENNNVLKTRGYHLEHNFGHGKKHLASLLAALNILAFLYHTYLELCDEKYQALRAALPTRQAFFDDVRALTRYLLFAGWDALLDFMLRGLEIPAPAPHT